MHRRTLLVLASIFAIGIGGVAVGTASAAVLTFQVGGGGSVTAPDPSGAAPLVCSNTAGPGSPSVDCTADRAAGTSITVTAAPSGGNKIAAWTSPCESAGTTLTCTFTVPAAATTVGTTFEADPLADKNLGCVDAAAGTMCAPNCAVGHLFGDGTQYWSAGGMNACRTAVRSGMMSIGGGKSHSYTFGDYSSRMKPEHICYWRSSGAVWPTVADATFSTTISALNTVSHTRHWAWGVEFEQGGGHIAQGFGDGCVSETGCVSLSDRTGGCPADGAPIALYDLATGVYTQSERTPFESAVPVADATPAAPAVGAREAAARAAEDARLTVVNGRSDVAGIRHLSCPSGTDMLHADTAIVGAQRGVEVEEPLVHHTLRRATFTITAVPPGAHVRYQVVCRAAGAPTQASTGGHIHGSTRGETHRTTQAGHHIFAGGGHDTVHATHPNAHILGGTGNDTIFIRANRVVVMGGPGNDRIESFAPGASHMEGNSGNDTLVSHRGRTTINSQDGSPGDTVICDQGSKAVVFIDKGDTVRGACKVAHRR